MWPSDLLFWILQRCACWLVAEGPTLFPPGFSFWPLKQGQSHILAWLKGDGNSRHLGSPDNTDSANIMENFRSLLPVTQGLTWPTLFIHSFSQPIETWSPLGGQVRNQNGVW